MAPSLSVRWSRYCRASRPVQARRRGPGRFLEFFAFDLQLRAARHLCKSGEMALGALPWAHCLCRRPTALANQPRRKSTKLQQSDMGGMPLMMECVSPADTYQHPEDMRLRHRCHSSLSHLDPLV